MNLNFLKTQDKSKLIPFERKVWSCYDCNNLRFPTQEAYDAHMKKGKHVQRKCKICNVTCCTQKALEIHHFKKHAQPKNLDDVSDLNLKEI